MLNAENLGNHTHKDVTFEYTEPENLGKNSKHSSSKNVCAWREFEQGRRCKLKTVTKYQTISCFVLFFNFFDGLWSTNLRVYLKFLAQTLSVWLTFKGNWLSWEVSMATSYGHVVPGILVIVYESQNEPGISDYLVKLWAILGST